MTRSSEVRVLATACAVAVMLLGAPATAAEPSAADVESARSAYVEGKVLRDKGDHAGALEKFRAAYSLAPTPITALELGREYVVQARLVEAREVLLSVKSLPVKPRESEKAAAARVEAANMAEHLRVAIPSVVIEVDVPRGATFEVQIDGDAMPTEALAAPRLLNPGRHEIVARSGDAEAKESVELAEGERRHVRLVLAPAPGSASTAPRTVAPLSTGPVAPLGRPGDATTASRTSILVPIGLGLAGVGTASALTLGGIAWGGDDDLRLRCRDGLCPPDVHDDLRRFDTLTTAANIAVGVALVGAVVAVVGFLSSPRPTSGTAHASAGGAR